MIALCVIRAKQTDEEVYFFFSLTTKILTLVGLISREIGNLEGQKLIQLPIQLKRKNQIKTIHASLAIEGKRILGKHQEILEVKNAINIYDHIDSFECLKICCKRTKIL